MLVPSSQDLECCQSSSNINDFFECTLSTNRSARALDLVVMVLVVVVVVA